IGVVHRDLKPENVLVTPEGRAKLLDFGLAKILPGAEADLGSGSQLTLDGMVMGTLPYLAPEQLQAASTRRRSDIFSLGVLVYEMLTGSTPFPGSSMVEYARAILTRNAEPPSLQRSEVPPWLDILVLSMLQIEPEDRPTATEVRRTLFSHFVPPAKARRAEPREPLPAGDGTCRGGPPAEPLDGEAPSRKVHSRKVQSGKATGDGYGEDDGNDRAPDAGLGPERAIGTEAESWYRPPSGWVVAALLILALVLLYLLG
ncbi:MAG: serine/threonine protein kinase, partial [Holophagales bacterium]|nr:serine/threonine protein kinase [Holophagales bacterium]